MFKQVARLKWLYTKLLLCCLTICCSGQELSRVNYGLNSPLRTKTVYDIFFSKTATLYIATDNGFWSFNGTDFKEHKQEGLNTIDVTNIQESEEGEIFFQNFAGDVFCWNGDSLRLQVDAKRLGFELNSYLSKGEYFYYWNKERIVVEHKDRQEVKTLLKLENLSDNFFTRMVNSNGYLLEYKSLTHIVWLLEKGRIRSVDSLKNRGRQHFISNYKNTYCIQGDDLLDNGSILDAEGNPICGFNQLKQKLILFRFQEIDSQFFVCTNQGLYLANGNKFHLNGSIVSNVLKDPEGNIWVSTITDGLFKISNLEYQLYPFKSSSGSRADFILKSKKDLIVSNLNGDIYALDSTNKNFKLYFKTDRLARTKNIFYSPKYNQYIHSGSKLVLLNQEDYSVAFELVAYISYYQNAANEMYAVSGGNTLLYGRDPEKLAYDSKPIKKGYLNYKEFRKYNKLFYTFSIDNCKSIVKTKDWIIAMHNDSLSFIDVSNSDSIRSYLLSEESEKLYLLGDRIFIQFKNMFVEYNLEAEVLGRIDRLNGLEQTINKVSTDGDYIIFSTKKAIYIYDAKSFKYIHQFNSENGISSIDFDKAWVYDGILYVNGSKGVSEIPLSIQFNEGAPALSLEKALVNGVERPLRSLFYTENNIKLKFIMSSFTTKGYVYWRLNGRAWKQLDWPLEIELEELQYGQYKIDLYAENELGVRSKTLTYDFQIEGPFWSKWWFFLAIASLAAFSIWWIYKFRIDRLKAKNELKNNLIASQMTALKSQMNPHFIFNALNSIQSLVKFQRNKEASKYVNKFAILLRQTLNYSDQDYIPLENEIELLQTYLEMENMRMEGKLNFKIEALEDQNILIPSMIIQPFVENAIKHGLLHKKQGEKKLEVIFKLKEELLSCTIEDNGVGREKAMEIKKQKSSYEVSFSTGATQKRLNLLQQLEEQKDLGLFYTDLKDAEGKAIGTRVELIIPIDEL